MMCKTLLNTPDTCWGLALLKTLMVSVGMQMNVLLGAGEHSAHPSC